MKLFLFVCLAGASCLLLTYDLVCGGDIVVALLIIGIIGAAAGAVSTVFAGEAEMPFGRLVTAFVAGALISEAGVFAHYYIGYGHRDPKLPVGIAVSLIEFGVISVVGSFALIVTTCVMRSRITRRLSR